MTVVLGALLVCATHGAATAGPDELGLEHAATAPGLMRRLMGRAFGGHEPYGMPHVNLHIDLSKVACFPSPCGGEGVGSAQGKLAHVQLAAWCCDTSCRGPHVAQCDLRVTREPGGGC